LVAVEVVKAVEVNANKQVSLINPVPTAAEEKGPISFL
jgi:hypothetical protein